VAWERSTLPRLFFQACPPSSRTAGRSVLFLKFEPVQTLVMRVLIVEDDKALADGLTRTLRQSGYAVDHADTGELALRACSGGALRLVVTRHQSSRGGRLRGSAPASPRQHAGSILILTRTTPETDRVRGLDLGADDYVTKPFRFPSWKRRVRALIRRSQVVKSPKLHFGRLSVDTWRGARASEPKSSTSPARVGGARVLLMRIGRWSARSTCSKRCAAGTTR